MKSELNSFINDVNRYKSVYEKFGQLYKKKESNVLNMRTLSSIKFLEFSAESTLKSFLKLTLDEQKSYMLSNIFKRVEEYTKELVYLEPKENLKLIKNYVIEKYSDEKILSWNEIDTSINPMFFHIISDNTLNEKVNDIRKWIKDELDINKSNLNEQQKIVLQKLIIKSVEKIFTKEDKLYLDLNYSYDSYVYNLMELQMKENLKDNHLSLAFNILERDNINSGLINKMIEYFQFKIEKGGPGANISLLNLKMLEQSNIIKQRDLKETVVSAMNDIENSLKNINVEVDGEYLKLNFLKVFNQSLLTGPESIFSDYSLRNYIYVMRNLINKISMEYDCNIYLDENENYLKFHTKTINKNLINLFEECSSDLGGLSFKSVQFAYGLKNESEVVNDFFKKIRESFESLFLLSSMLHENSLGDNKKILKTKALKF